MEAMAHVAQRSLEPKEYLVSRMSLEQAVEHGAVGLLNVSRIRRWVVNFDRAGIATATVLSKVQSQSLEHMKTFAPNIRGSSTWSKFRFWKFIVRIGCRCQTTDSI